MKIVFILGVLLVLAFLALCGYWYMNPDQMPEFLQEGGAGFELSAD